MKLIGWLKMKISDIIRRILPFLAVKKVSEEPNLLFSFSGWYFRLMETGINSSG